MATTVREPIIARYDICNSADRMFEQAVQRLTYAMEQRHINKNQLQKDAGLSSATVYKMYRTPSNDSPKSNTYSGTIMRICMALNVSADWLLFGDGTFRGLPCGEPSLRPEPYDVARDEETRSAVAPSRSVSSPVSSNGVDLPERVVTPDDVSRMTAYLRANAGSTAGITPELVAQALQPAPDVTSRHKSSQVAPDSARALDDIVLKGANNDVLLALIRQLQSQNDTLQQQHVRDMQLLSEAQTKNTALQSVNTTLRQTIAQLSTSLSVQLPKVGDILSPTSPYVPGTPSPSASDDSVSIASDETQPVTK